MLVASEGEHSLVPGIRDGLRGRARGPRGGRGTRRLRSSRPAHLGGRRHRRRHGGSREPGRRRHRACAQRSLRGENHPAQGPCPRRARGSGTSEPADAAGGFAPRHRPAARRDRISLCREAARDVREPRSDSCRRPSGSGTCVQSRGCDRRGRRRPPGSRRRRRECGSLVRRCIRRRGTSRPARRVVRAGTGDRARRHAGGRGALRPRNLRQAGPARRSLLRRNDLRDAVEACAAGSVAGGRAGARRVRRLRTDRRAGARGAAHSRRRRVDHRDRGTDHRRRLRAAVHLRVRGPVSSTWCCGGRSAAPPEFPTPRSATAAGRRECS